MGWKWNDAVGGAVDGLMTYGPYGAIAGAAIGGWSKDFDKGLTGDSRSGLVSKAYGWRNGNMGTKIMGNFSGDNRDSQVLDQEGNFSASNLFGSVGNMAGSYYGGGQGGSIGSQGGTQIGNMIDSRGGQRNVTPYGNQGSSGGNWFGQLANTGISAYSAYKGASNSGGSYNNPSGRNASISFGSGGTDGVSYGGASGGRSSGGGSGWGSMLSSLGNSGGSGGSGAGGYAGLLSSLMNSQGSGSQSSGQGGAMGSPGGSPGGSIDIGQIFEQFQQQRNPSDTSDPNYDPMEHAGLIRSRYPFIPDDTFQAWLRNQAPSQGYQFAGR